MMQIGNRKGNTPGPTLPPRSTESQTLNPPKKMASPSLTTARARIGLWIAPPIVGASAAASARNFFWLILAIIKDALFGNHSCRNATIQCAFSGEKVFRRYKTLGLILQSVISQGKDVTGTAR